MEIEIAIAVLILIVMTFLATVDMAFSQISDVGLRRLSSDYEVGAKVKSSAFLQDISENRPRFRFSLSAAIQILLIIFSVLVAAIVNSFVPTNLEMVLYSLVIGLFFSIAFRQVIPRFITLKNPEKKLLYLLPFVRPLYDILPSIADPLEPSFRGKAQHKLETTIVPNEPTEAEKEDNAEDRQALIEMGEAEGILEEKDRELLETMFEFSETRAGEIMTPRTEIVAVPFDATVIAARDLIVEEKYSRLPVYRETIDNIEGVIYVRDLLNAWVDGKENQTIENLIRPAFFIPETKSAAELLKNMQLSRVQIAIVIDEYGGVAGLVTVEDIVEEIVGEIEDEDTEEEEIVEIIEGTDKTYYDVIGSTEIGKIERLFGFEIEDDDFTTIAGLVTSEAGYVPKKGERLQIRGLDIEVLQADEKRLSLLRVKKSTPENEFDNDGQV
ncbi:MAG: hemolysin family protein [Pyrinomonadaceae bacterium]